MSVNVCEFVSTFFVHPRLVLSTSNNPPSSCVTYISERGRPIAYDQIYHVTNLPLVDGLVFYGWEIYSGKWLCIEAHHLIYQRRVCVRKQRKSMELKLHSPVGSEVAVYHWPLTSASVCVRLFISLIDSAQLGLALAWASECSLWTVDVVRSQRVPLRCWPLIELKYFQFWFLI